MKRREVPDTLKKKKKKKKKTGLISIAISHPYFVFSYKKKNKKASATSAKNWGHKGKVYEWLNAWCGTVQFLNIAWLGFSFFKKNKSGRIWEKDIFVSVISL